MGDRVSKNDNTRTNQKIVTAQGPAHADATRGVDSDAIAARSYELWQERGGPIGSPEIDWFRAKDELRNSEPAAQSAV